jgi:hypothetical protein
MKTVYNHQVILHVLNSLTKETFIHDEDNERTYYSRDFEVIETEFYRFDLYELKYDFDTGAYNEFLIKEDIDLSDVVQNILNFNNNFT